MNQKQNENSSVMNKIKKFFKKDGFYVALFVGLCLVTIIGAIAIKNAGSKANLKAEVPNDKEITLNLEEKENSKVNTAKENAERVEKSKEENKNNTKPVGTDSKMNFEKPIEGKLLKGHSEPYIFKDGKQVKEGEKGDSSYSYGGITVSCKLGAPVKAAEDGIIEEVVENDVTYGVTVVVKHPNGIKTSYANLDKKVNVKKGDKVKKGQEIGKVGNTASTLKMHTKADFLHIKVLSKQDNKYTEVDPLKYFNYKK